MNRYEYTRIYPTINLSVEKAATKIVAIKDFISNEFVHGGHLASLASPAIAISVMMLLDIEIHWEFISIIYFGTLCIYNYDYVRSLHIDYNDNTYPEIFIF